MSDQVEGLNLFLKSHIRSHMGCDVNTLADDELMGMSAMYPLRVSFSDWATAMGLRAPEQKKFSDLTPEEAAEINDKARISEEAMKGAKQ